MTAPLLLLLAAGRSTRMRGRDKLLEEVDGMPLLRRMAMRAARAGETRVVLAPGQAARRAALDGVSVEIRDAPDGAGMAASIRAGIAEGAARPVLILLADMPEITATDLHLMISLHARARQTILRAAGAQGQPGHPVLFPADLVPELMRLEGDQGARDLLKREAARVHLLPLKGDRALVDLDTPEDWTAWRNARST